MEKKPQWKCQYHENDKWFLWKLTQSEGKWDSDWVREQVFHNLQWQNIDINLIALESYNMKMQLYKHQICMLLFPAFSCLLWNWLHLMFEKSTAFTFYRIWFIRAFFPFDSLRGEKNLFRFLRIIFNSFRNLFSFFQIYFIHSEISWGLHTRQNSSLEKWEQIKT